MKPASGKRVWVVGTGFLGSALAAHARAGGDCVLGIDCRVGGGVCGDAALPSVLREAQGQLPFPELVYLCMATGGGGVESYQHTYVGVVENLRHHLSPCRVVFCSSLSVYGDTAGKEVDEKCPVKKPPSSRAAILLHAERLVLESGGIVCRLAPLYGAGRCELLRRHVAGEPCLPGSPDRWLNYLHRDDAVRALYLLGHAAALPGHLFDVCGENGRKEEVYALLERVTGVPTASVSDVASGRGCASRLVRARLLRSLGWAPQMTMEAYIRQQMSGR